MLFIVKWDATGMTDEQDLSEQALSREAAATLTARLRAEDRLPAGVQFIHEAEVSEDGGWEDGECRVFVKVEIVVEAEDPATAACIGNDAFFVAVTSAMIGEDAQSAYDLGEFVVLDIDVHVDEPDGELAGALAD